MAIVLLVAIVVALLIDLVGPLVLKSRGLYSVKVYIKSGFVSKKQVTVYLPYSYHKAELVRYPRYPNEYMLRIFWYTNNKDFCRNAFLSYSQKGIVSTTLVSLRLWVSLKVYWKEKGMQNLPV